MKDKILIVDDVEMNREILSEILEQRACTILEADNGLTAQEMIEQYQEELAIVLLDLVMPGIDGYGVLRWMNEKHYIDRIPVLVISGDISIESESRCFDLGVSDFIHKPFNRELVLRRVYNVVDLYQYKNDLEDTVLRQTEDLRQQNQELILRAEQLRASKLHVIDILGTVVESRNLESGLHIKRVKDYTRILAENVMRDFPEYGLDENIIEVMTSVSALHDVGKIAIPDSILLKPGRLTPEEFDTMKTHTTRGCELLSNVDGVWEADYEQMCYDICRFHHERFDGRGYPDGLKGEEIPIAAQVVSVADVYDALVSERCYKKPFPPDKAYDMIQNGECGTFNPKLMISFAHAREKYENVLKNKEQSM